MRYEFQYDGETRFMTTKHSKILIIGAGPAGYTAAIYAARAGLKPIQVLGMQPGGQLMITTEVENYPGYAEVVQGPWMMEQMKLQAEKVGTEMINDMIQHVDFSQKPFVCKGDGETTYTADAVIIATGAQAKWLGLESEKKFMGYGVSACATCDGFFFRDQKVMVIGGGNTAVEEALFMTNHAREVVLVHRRDTLRAEDMLQKRLFSHPKITVIWDHQLDDILGEENPLKVTGAILKNTKTGALTDHKVDGIFIAIGHVPETRVFKESVAVDAEGYIKVHPGTTKTNITGVFAAGDVQDKVYRQAVTAAGQGCMAALEAEKFLQGLS